MRRLIPCFVCLWIAAAAPADAASQTQTLTGTARVAGLAKLSLSPLALTFPDANPDVTPLVASSGGPISIAASGRTSPGNTVTLTVQSDDDLRSGTNVISAAAVTWTASGAGFVGGTLSKASAQPVGSWVGSGSRTGSQTFSFANSWTYASGTYTVTLTYTLTVP